MKRHGRSLQRKIEFDRDVLRAIESDPKFATAYFDELRERPVAVRIELLRQFALAAHKAKARKKASSQ